MKILSKELVVGDLHGEWGSLNTLINKTHPEIILQVGDFGWWPKFHKNLYGIKNSDTRLYFAPGNHEDWDDLDSLDNNELMPNVFYMRFGDLLTLPDGRVVMFCGGAKSIDEADRIMGRDWFPQEKITDEDMKRLPPANTKIDIVISHTCPTYFMAQMANRGLIYYNEYKREHRDSSRQALSYIRDTYKPKYWYFGHFHRYTHGTWLETKWFSLSMPGRTGWWKFLKGK